MADYFKFAVDDDATPLSVAEQLLAAVIESKDPAKIYSEQLITALARAGTIKQHEAKRRLQAAFPKDFAGNVREFWAKIRGAEEELRREQLPAGGYILNGDGGYKANLANAIIMLRALPVAYNAFSCRVVCLGPLPWRCDSQGTAWANNDDVKAAEWCQHRHLEVGKLTVADAIGAVAHERPVHPPQDFLKNLVWDGEPRVDRWLHKYMSCADTPYVRSVAAKWLIAAVKRIMEPGCQSDYTLVLEGEQGKRKSGALRALTGNDWFTDDVDNIGPKDSAMQIQGFWIVELPELDAFRRAEMTTIKAWLVRRIDNFRPPYGARTEMFPRQNVFAASTNRYDWGLDDTGLRRFWPVRVMGNIDIDGITAAREQIWAEAFFRYSEGESSYLSGTAESDAKDEQHARQDRDIWSDIVEDWIASPTTRDLTPLRSTVGRLYTSELLAHALNLLPRDQNQAAKLRVTRILRLQGYVQARESAKGEDGKRPEYWRPMRTSGGDWD